MRGHVDVLIDALLLIDECIQCLLNLMIVCSIWLLLVNNAEKERGSGKTNVCHCRSDTSTPWHAWALRPHSYFVSLFVLAHSWRQDSDTDMATPTAQTVRRWVMTGSVAAITATGAWYGAGLKAQQEFKQVQ